MRRFIIGPKGSILSQIEAKSYTRINFPRKDEEDMSGLNNDDTVLVTIMGEPSGIKVAKEEIEKIVGEKVNSKKTQLCVSGND
jgi:rRNA processing protein Krr1/Pno1